MNFVLEPQNFSGKNWNSPINIGPASLFTAITYNVNSFALYAPSGATLSGSSATEIQFQGSNDGVNWTVLYSTTTTVGSVGEVITSISSNPLAGGGGKWTNDEHKSLPTIPGSLAIFTAIRRASACVSVITITVGLISVGYASRRQHASNRHAHNRSRR